MSSSSARPERTSDATVFVPPSARPEAPRPDPVRLDPTDVRILVELGADSRLTYAEVGARVGLSAPSVHERVKKLEARGVIQGYRAVLDAEHLGYGVLAFIAIMHEMASDWQELATAFAGIPEILECHHVAGAEDFLLKVRARDTLDLERVLNCVQQCGHVATTRTVVVLSSPFADRPVPVAALTGPGGA